jgi:hypothetical protein
MKGIRNTVWLFSLIVFSTTAWADQSLLNRCKRNGQRYLERAKKADAYARDKANHERIVRTLRNQDIGNGKIQGITFDGQPRFEAWAKDCVTAGWSEKIKDLPGYSEVLKYYEETKAIYSNLDNKYIPELYKKSQSAVLDKGPGGDKRVVLDRWDARPRRCIESGEWDEAAGNAPVKSRTTARIAGLEDEGKDKRIHSKVFSGKGSAGRWPSGMTAWDHLVRIACGAAVEGIDPVFRPRRQIYGSQFLEGDSRIVLARAIIEGTDDAGHKLLYKLAQIQEAFGATEWNAKEDYEAFLYSNDAIGKPPAEAKVASVIDRLFPGRKYEKDNLLFVYRRGIKAMKEIAAVFDKMESRYPRMKAVYRDSAVQARRRWQKRRKRYANAYRILDPITARLLDDPTSESPADCESKLLGLRAELARKIKPRNEEAVGKLRVEHPLGYQITEALAYCYLGKGKFARAKLEADSLKRTNRRVNLGEEIFYSRRDAIGALEQKIGSAEKIRKLVPNYTTHSLGMPVPGSVQYSPRFHAAIDSQGNFRIRGENAREPAVVAAKKKVPAGVKLVFKKYTFTYKYRDTKCKDTGKVDRYEFTPSGNKTTVRPIYRQKCWEVGPVKKKRITYQEKPVIIPKADAVNIKKGMQLTVLDNLDLAGDAVIIDCWWPKKGKKSALLLQGIPIR